MKSGGKSCSLAVGGLPVRSHLGHVKVSLSKSPNPLLLLTSCLVPYMAANHHCCVNECVNEKHTLYSALDKGAIQMRTICHLVDKQNKDLDFLIQEFITITTQTTFNEDAIYKHLTIVCAVFQNCSFLR